MLTSNQFNDLYGQITNHLATAMDQLENQDQGGALRRERGVSTEEVVDLVCRQLREAEIPLNPRIGDDDLQSITVNGVTKEQQVDRHVYVNDRLVCVIECKAYLDSCMYDRACTDFRTMRLRYPGVKTIILALENAISDAAVTFTNARDGGCDHIVYLCKGKRRSDRPLYRSQFRKVIERDALQTLVTLLISCV